MLINGFASESGASGSPDTVRLLTSALILFPEIGSVRLADGRTTFIIEFFLSEYLDTSRFREFVRELREAYGVFESLSGGSFRLLQIRHSGKNPASSRSSEVVTAIDYIDKTKNSQPGLFSSNEFWPIAEKGSDSEVAADSQNLSSTGSLFPEEEVPQEYLDLWDSWASGKDSVIVERDLFSFTVDELSFLVGILQQELGKLVVTACDFPCSEEEAEEEKENFVVALESVRSAVSLDELPNNQKQWTNLSFYAYRDEDRVIVLAD